MSSSENLGVLHAAWYKAEQAERDAATHMKKKKRVHEKACKAFRKAEEEARDTLNAYAQQSCRALCDKLHATLPRELRDGIYRYLLPSWPAEFHYNDGVSTRHPLFGQTNLWHLMREEWMGMNCIQEIQEEYLRTSKFHLTNGHAATNFCVADPLDLGLLACNVCVDVEMACACENYDFAGVNPETPLYSGGGWGGWGATEDGVDNRRPKSELLESLHALFGFRQGSKITVDITMINNRLDSWHKGDPTSWLWKEVMPHIFPTLRKLSVAGRKVKVRIHDESYDLEASSSKLTVTDWKHYVDTTKAKADEQKRMRERAALVALCEKADEARYLGVEDLFMSSED